MRLIDSEFLEQEISRWINCPGNGEYYCGYDNALTAVLDLIADAPTLTPPNELMEALEAINNAAVAYIEGGPYENDLPGMELALKIDRLSRDFVRPPEGEDDT